MVSGRKKQVASTIREGSFYAEIFRRKMGEYRYKSPRFGYKRAYRYNQDVYVYEDGTLDWMAHIMLKDVKRDEIRRYLKDVQSTIKELRNPKTKNSVALVRAINAQGIRRNVVVARR